MKHTYLVALALALMVSGCASSPYQSRDSRSVAGNVAHAADMKDIRDAKVAPDQYRSYRAQRAAVDTGFNALLLTSDAGLGLDLVDGLMGGILWTMLSPADPSAYSKVIAWMPASMADDREAAREKFSDIALEAIKAVLIERGANWELVHNDRATKRESKNWILFESHEWNCAGDLQDVKTNCRVAIDIMNPEDTDFSPDFVQMHTGQRSYAFDGSSRFGSNIAVGGPEGATVPWEELSAAISQQLPPWAYLYKAAGKSYRDDGSTVPFPHIYHQGKAHLFIRPDS